jgi:conjugal transfer pilus assembly protein TraB
VSTLNLRDGWQKISPEWRRIAMFAVLVVIVVVSAKVFKREKSVVKKAEPKPEMSVVVPARKEDGLGEVRTKIETLTGNLEKERTRASDLESKLKLVTEGNKEVENRQVKDLMSEVGRLREEVKLTRSTMMDAPGKGGNITLPDLPPPVEPPKKESLVAARPKIRIFGGSAAEGAAVTGTPAAEAQLAPGGNKITMGAKPAVSDKGATVTTPANYIGDGSKSGATAAAVSQQQLQFIPAGTIFQGVMMNGVDAPTAGQAQKNTVPILMRIKKEAILPNRVTQDMRECFIILSGYGVMSSERVKMRTEAISCVRADGGVIESKLDGYVVDIDGKEGIKGTLVTKQGAIIARGLVAGFLSGFGAMLTPSMGSSLSLNSGQQSYLSPDLGAASQAGAMRGVSQAAADYSKFFLETAKEMHPVIEIPSGIEGTVILVRGVSLALGGTGKKSDIQSKGKSWQSTISGN